MLRWGGFGLAATAAAVLTPHGVQTLLFPLQLTRSAGLAHIGEWAPADFSRLGSLEVALLAGLFVALTRPLRLTLVRAALLLLLLHLALQHVRYDQMLGIVGALILAEPLAAAFAQPAAPPGGWRPRTAPVVAFAGLALAAALLGARLSWPVTRHDGLGSPISAVAAVPAQVAATPVLNDYSFGGYLIDRKIAPFIDSRAELYGDAFLEAYAKLLSGDRTALAQTLAARHVGWTLLVPGTPIARTMDETPGWRRLYADRFAVVHVRDGVAMR